MESDLATLPHAVVTCFTSLLSSVVAAMPPPRSRWRREQLAAVFSGPQWLQPSGPAPFLHP